MPLSSSVYSGWDQIETLADDWERLTRSCSRGIEGPDATTAFTWAKALSATHLKDAELRVLQISSADQIIGLVPTYAVRQPGIPFAKNELRVVTQAYGGRGSLLIADQDLGAMEFMLNRLQSDLPRWDVFLFGVVENSDCHHSVMQAAERASLHLHCLNIEESPYIELRPSWDEVLARLPKKMRWTIRKCESELRSRGPLAYEEVREVEDIPSLLESIYAIERSSWKEQSGSSITAQHRQQEFYEEFAILAARSEILSAHILHLNRQPIAYVLGIAAGDDVFLDLKESFDARYSEFSPGHVLKRFVLQSLIARGTRLYDFMGRCEAYKMRWTDKTYRRLTFALYNNSLKGAFLHLRSKLIPRSTPAARSGVSD